LRKKKKRFRMACKTTRAMTEDQIKALKTICLASRHPHRNHALVSMGIGGAMRIGELVSLSLDQVLDPKGRPKNVFFLRPDQSKSKVEGTIYLTPKAFDSLKSYLKTIDLSDRSRPLFSSQKGGFMTACYGTQLIRKLMDRAGLGKEYGSHSMRKSWASKAMKQGINPMVVSRGLRHGKGKGCLATTTRYVQMLGTDMEDAVANLDI